MRVGHSWAVLAFHLHFRLQAISEETGKPRRLTKGAKRRSRRRKEGAGAPGRMRSPDPCGQGPCRPHALDRQPPPLAGLTEGLPTAILLELAFRLVSRGFPVTLCVRCGTSVSLRALRSWLGCGSGECRLMCSWWCGVTPGLFVT